MELEEIVKPAVTVREDVSFREALSLMVKQQTNTLLVTDAQGQLVGEVSVSDLLDAIVPEYLDGDSIAAHFATEEMFLNATKDAADTPVHEFMNTDIEPVMLDDGLMAVATTAIAHKKARIPVVNDERHPIGIVSRRGLKKILADSLEIPDQS